MGSVDRITIVNRSGVPYAELSDYECDPLDWKLNGDETGGFSLGVYNKDVAAIQTKTREVQFWRGGTCIAWHRLDKARRQGDRLQVGTVGLFDYFKSRFIGPPTNNKLANAGFESGLTSWTNVNGATSAVSTSPVVRGAQAARVTNTTISPLAAIRQTYTEVNTGTAGFSVGFNCSGWLWIENRGGYSGLRDFIGLYVRSYTSGPTLDEKSVPIAVSTPGAQWVRFEIESQITAPTGTTFHIDVDLRSPPSDGVNNGIIVWDEIFLGPSTYVGSATVTDFNNIISNVVNYALQKDAALNITYAGVSTGQSGVRLYAEGDHANIATILGEFPATEIAEFDITWNAAATTRTFQLYAARKGSFKASHVLDDGDGGSIIGGVEGWEEGTAETISKPRWLGQGDGVDREYAQATDTSLTDGVIFESVSSAPQEVPLAGLDGLATQQLARQRRAVQTPSTLKTKAEGRIGLLAVGDTVPVRIASSGWPTVNQTMRVVGLRLNPADDTLEHTLNLP